MEVTARTRDSREDFRTMGVASKEVEAEEEAAEVVKTNDRLNKYKYY